MRTFLAGALGTAALAWAPAALAAGPEGPPERPDTHQVMFVGNNWDGTADIVDAATFQRLRPHQHRSPTATSGSPEILREPGKLGVLPRDPRQVIGEGHDQFVDDMFTTHDGRFVYVSRPSFADVVGIEIAHRQDRLALPDGGLPRRPHGASRRTARALLVSDSTANKVHVLDTATGHEDRRVRRRATRRTRTTTRADGKRIFHASIGAVYTPTDRPELGRSRREQGRRATSRSSTRTASRSSSAGTWARSSPRPGYPGMSSAVRPMAIAPGRALRLPPGLLLPRLRRVRHAAASSVAAGRRSCR